MTDGQAFVLICVLSSLLGVAVAVMFDIGEIADSMHQIAQLLEEKKP